MSDLFTKNRKKIVSEMADGSVLVLFAGAAPKKIGDEYYPYSPPRDFYYCAGLESENIMLLIHKTGGGAEETLFLEKPDDERAKWVGYPLLEADAVKISGVRQCKFLDEFENDILKFLYKKEPVLYLDIESRPFGSPAPAEIVFAEKIRKNCPHVIIKNINPIIAEKRAVKTKDEINFIKKAIGITEEAFLAMMMSAAPGMAEYEIESHFDYTLKKHGVRDRAFATIAASGPNAATLHYSANKRKTADGDLILIDAGAQFGCYSADITRTFPVNGKFTDRQKLLYDIVLEGQQKVIDAIKPGAPFKDLNETLIKHYEKALKKIGLINDKDEVKDYYYHKVSHSLGLETHDTGRSVWSDELKKGMVITVEPGLYVAAEGIGIRIEDDAAVTDKGCEILSKGLIKTTDEIEAFMGAR